MLWVLLFAGVLFAQPKYLKECLPKAIDAETAIKSVKEFTGKVYKVYLTRRKKTGECLYKIKGTEGTAVVDATTGKLVKFYKKR
ncbi:MAG: hypothetical protein GXO04_02485 [Aquificae bacterium]|nr:hypothetical protein [Aquificota bacterium]